MTPEQREALLAFFRALGTASIADLEAMTDDALYQYAQGALMGLDGDPHFEQAPDGIGWKVLYRFRRLSDGHEIDVDVSCTAAAMDAARGVVKDIDNRGLLLAQRLAGVAGTAHRVTVWFDPDDGGNPRHDYHE